MKRSLTNTARMAIAAGVLLCTLPHLRAQDNANPGATRQLVAAGVLGNSGEQGKTLVRFAPGGASGLGVAVDRQGSLWDRGGPGQLNRYAADGRLLASYRLPVVNGSRDWDLLTIVGQRVVLLLGNGLYTLDVDAPAGTEVRALKVEASRMSYGSRNGEVAIWSKGKLLLANVTDGTTREAGQLADAQWMDMGPDGAIYAVADWKINKFENGVAASGNWPRSSPGERPQLLDGAWWGHSWHGTIRRFNSSLEPDPGVVLGGASGSFIGHLVQNPEVSNGRGLAKLRPGCFVVSGIGGILHLLDWQDATRQFNIVRRIGAVPSCSGLGLDRAGNVWWYAGSWRWDDRPETPLRNGINAPDGAGIAQPVMLPNDRMVAPCYLWGRPGFYNGALSGEISAETTDQSKLARDAVASAVYRNSGNQLVLLAVNAAGRAQSFFIEESGRFRADAGDVQLQTVTPIKAVTSLATPDAGTLLAAVDGYIVAFAREGENWKESARWNSWADGGASFGSRIFLSADAGRLWVTDTENHRVLCFDATTRALLASFGGQRGDDLHHLDRPQAITARGERAVVYDSGNQRLFKLKFQ